MNFLKDTMLVLFGGLLAADIIVGSNWDYFSAKGATEPKYVFTMAIGFYIIWAILDYRETFNSSSKHGDTTK